MCVGVRGCSVFFFESGLSSFFLNRVFLFTFHSGFGLLLHFLSFSFSSFLWVWTIPFLFTHCFFLFFFPFKEAVMRRWSNHKPLLKLLVWSWTITEMTWSEAFCGFISTLFFKKCFLKEVLKESMMSVQKRFSCPVN